MALQRRSFAGLGWLLSGSCLVGLSGCFFGVGEVLTKVEPAASTAGASGGAGQGSPMAGVGSELGGVAGRGELGGTGGAAGASSSLGGQGGAPAECRPLVLDCRIMDHPVGQGGPTGDGAWSIPSGGTLTSQPTVGAGWITLQVKARGAGGGARPVLTVTVNGTVLGTATVESGIWGQFPFLFYSPGGPAALTISGSNGILVLDTATLDCPIPDPWDPTAPFSISNAGSGLCLGMPATFSTSLPKVIQTDCVSTRAKVFRIENQSPPTGTAYHLRDDGTTNCLDLYTASTLTGAAVIRPPCSLSLNQQWSLRDTGGGQYVITSRFSGLVMTVDGTPTADGSALVQRPDIGASTQRFRIQRK